MLVYVRFSKNTQTLAIVGSCGNHKTLNFFWVFHVFCTTLQKNTLRSTLQKNAPYCSFWTHHYFCSFFHYFWTHYAAEKHTILHKTDMRGFVSRRIPIVNSNKQVGEVSRKFEISIKNVDFERFSLSLRCASAGFKSCLYWPKLSVVT